MRDAIQVLMTAGQVPESKSLVLDGEIAESPAFASVFADANDVETHQALPLQVTAEAEEPKADVAAAESPDVEVAATVVETPKALKKASLTPQPDPEKPLPQTQPRSQSGDQAPPDPAAVEPTTSKGERTNPATQPQTERASYAQAALAKAAESKGKSPATDRQMPIANEGFFPPKAEQALARQVSFQPPSQRPSLPIQTEDVPRRTGHRFDERVKVPETMRPSSSPAEVAKPSSKIPLTTAPVFALTSEHGGLFALESDSESILLQQPRALTGPDGSIVARSITTSAPQVQAEVARNIGGQLAVAISQTKPGITEVALSPQELGRVRMTLSAQDNAMVLSIMAERPETQELMRRHIDHLNQEFRNLGFADVKFSFDDGTENQHQKTDGQNGAVEAPHDAVAAADDVPVRSPIPNDAALDLRL